MTDKIFRCRFVRLLFVAAVVSRLSAANQTEKSDAADGHVRFFGAPTSLAVDFPRTLSFGIHCPGGPVAGPMTETITNISANTITITNVVISGTNAADFVILTDSGPTNLAPGQTRSFQLSFAPGSLGVKKAMLQITGADPSRFDVSVALDGADIDNIVQSSLTNIDFGTRDIDAPPSSEESIVISNNGSTDLDFTVEFSGNTNDFTLVADASPIPAHGNAVLQVAFAPKSQGAKSALVRVRMISCSGTNIDIALAGVGSSTVHHFVWDPIGATQFVGEPFPARVTAQDRNNSSVTNFHGTVKLMTVFAGQTNTVLIMPTNSAPFANGSWTGVVAVLQPAAPVQLLARDNSGHTGISGAFNTQLRDDLSIIVTDAPDPALNGQSITYVLTVSNTGPVTATGVMVTNQLSSAVKFLNATASQGSVTQIGSVVVANLGSLAAASNSTVTIVTEPSAGFSTATNVASVARNEPETFLGNNRATNTTVLGPFGQLVVTPASNFTSTGLSGGPFSPTNQIYTLSNAGTASLTWQVNPGPCNLPPGLAGWWPLDGNASDAVSTNDGVLIGGPVYTNGMVGAALLFDGIDDMVRIRAASNINVGTGNGLTIETWINPFDVSTRRPLVTWTNATQFWIDFVTNGAGAGSLYANVISKVGVSHAFSSPGGLILSNTWQHVALTYNTNTGLAVLYRNGVAIQQQNLGSFVPSTASDLILGRHSLLSYLGVMDDVSVYNQALSQADIQAIYAAGSLGKCPNRVIAAQCTTPGGLVAWFPFDGSTANAGGNSPGTILGNPVFTNGFIGQALFFDGTDDGVQEPDLNVGLGDSFTFETWFNVPDANRRGPIFEWDNGGNFSGPLCFMGVVGTGSFYVNLVDTGNGGHLITTGTGFFTANQWCHMAVTYNKLTGIARIYVNGGQAVEQTLGTFTPRTDGSLFLGRRAAVGFEESFTGALDESRVYNRELTATEIQNIFLDGSSGKCGNPAWYALSRISGALAPGLATNVNVFLTTSAANLKVGLYFDWLIFTNTSNGRGTTSRIAQLNVITVPPPHIESIAAIGTNVVLTWTAVPGGQYVVQFKPSLQVTNWSDLPGSVTATNVTAQKLDARQPLQRFYQIRVLP